jgi:hypothetical protein
MKEGVMKSIRTFTIFYSLTVLFSACGYQYPGLIVSPFKFSYESIDSRSGIDLEPRPVDRGDYVPVGGSMNVVRGDDTNKSIRFGLEVFQPLPLDFIIGLSGDYLFASPYGNNLFFCQGLRNYNIEWWDWIPYEEVDLERSPSIGWYFGKLFGSKRGMGGLLLQYGMSIGYYKFVRYELSGVDVIGGQNYATLKNTVNLGSGMTVRNTIEIGIGEALRLGFWWEKDGIVNMGGIQLIFSASLPTRRIPECGDYDYPGKDYSSSTEDTFNYLRDCLMH